MNALTETWLRLLANGHDPVPVVGKIPPLAGWPTLRIDAAEVRTWEKRFPNATGAGVRGAALDFDIKDPEAADAARQEIGDWLGERGHVLRRTGVAPKFLVPLRTAAPVAKIVQRLCAPNGVEGRIEFLCAPNQQYIAAGIHPDTRKPYIWDGRDLENTPRDELPEISGEEARELVQRLSDLLVEEFGYERIEGAPPRNGNGHATPAFDLNADVETLLAAMVDGTFNATHCHVIPRLIHLAWHPGEIADFVIEHTKRRKLELGMPWRDKHERGIIVGRVRSAVRNLFMKEYDHTAGVIPDWLAIQFYVDWEATLAKGLRPELHHGRDGWAVRGIAVNGHATDEGTPRPPFPPEQKPGSTAGPPRRFQLVPFGELRPGSEQSYLVDELIPLHGIVLFWGKQKCLKSFLTYDLCFHIARCQEYRGRNVLQGAVVYCAFEGAHGYRKRAEALRRFHGVPDDEVVPLYLIPGRANMIKEYPLLIAAVREQLAGKAPRVITLDTLNKSLVGSEGKDVDMAAYIVAAEALRDAFDCVVIIIHHCGYDETHPRGHTSLVGAVDAEFEIVRQGMLVTLKNITMRDGSEGFEVRSQAEVVEVGEDLTGKVLTSLVITPTDAPAAPAKKKRGRPNVGIPTLVEALRAALAERGGIFRPEGARAAEHVASESEVRLRFDIAYPAGEADPAKAAEATGVAYRRALHDAVADGVICKGVRDGDPVLWFKAPQR